MRSIRLVSDSEGEKLRKFESEIREKIKNLLVGSRVIDVIFDSGVGIVSKDISGLVIEKDGDVYEVTIHAHEYYECIESNLVIENKDGKEVSSLIKMITPCDTCKKSEACEERLSASGWIIDCKIKE